MQCTRYPVVGSGIERREGGTVRGGDRRRSLPGTGSLLFHGAGHFRLRRSRQRGRAGRRHPRCRDPATSLDWPKPTVPSTRSSSRRTNEREASRHRFRDRLRPHRPGLGRRSLPDLAGPSRALPGRPHRSLRRRVVSGHARGRDDDRQGHGELHEPRGHHGRGSTRRRGAARTDRRGPTHHLGPAVSSAGAQAHPAGLRAGRDQSSRAQDSRTLSRPARALRRRRRGQRVMGLRAAHPAHGDSRDARLPRRGHRTIHRDRPHDHRVGRQLRRTAHRGV